MMKTNEYVSDRLRRIGYLANLNGKLVNGETYAFSFSEVQSQLDEAYVNARLIQIQFLD